MRFPQVKAD